MKFYDSFLIQCSGLSNNISVDILDIQDLFLLHIYTYVLCSDRYDIATNSWSTVYVVFAVDNSLKIIYKGDYE